MRRIKKKLMCSEFEIYKLLVGNLVVVTDTLQVSKYFHAWNLLFIQTLQQTREHDKQKFKC